MFRSEAACHRRWSFQLRQAWTVRSKLLSSTYSSSFDPVNRIASTANPSKIERFAFDEVLADGRHTLGMVNDTDFDPANAGDNNFYVFAVDANKR